MTGWGQDGPLAHSAGHDIGYLGLSGALHAIGRAGGPPQVPVNLLGDFAGGSLYLVVGVLAALVEARGSGQGQVVDAAIVDGAAHLTTVLLGALAGGNWQQERGTNLLDTGAPFYDVYETSDGEYMAVGAIEPQFYAELIRLLGPHRAGSLRPANWPELRKRSPRPSPADPGRVDASSSTAPRPAWRRCCRWPASTRISLPGHLCGQGRRPPAGAGAAILPVRLPRSACRRRGLVSTPARP